MEIAMDGSPEVPEIPEGISLRTFRVGEDERPVYEAESAAWAEYPRWRDEGFERWSKVFEGDDFDPSAWLVALEGDRVVGFSQNLGYLDMGWVQNLGTIPEARGRGLGELLLRRTFRHYRDRGIRRVGLSVSSERSPAAWRLYERCGMTEVLRYTNYRKPLDLSELGGYELR
jgi:ribosomal protein S18 acetylase RimI-like enzyme